MLNIVLHLLTRMQLFLSRYSSCSATILARFSRSVPTLPPQELLCLLCFISAQSLGVELLARHTREPKRLDRASLRSGTCLYTTSTWFGRCEILATLRTVQVFAGHSIVSYSLARTAFSPGGKVCEQACQA